MSTALKNGAATVNSHGYVYNNGSQRMKQTLTDSSYVDYAYDNLGQLDTALTKTSGGAAVSGQQFDYGYDAGWNMTNRATGTGTSAYTVNDRNQATSVAGYAQSYNALGNRTQEMTGTTTSFDYTYDAENQLISVATDTYGTPDANRWKMEFVYDGRGRMRIRKDYIWLTGAWYPNGEQRYAYDGMRLLQQRSSGNVPQVSYTRGLDLSGSLEGAGGIGGLLARSTHATTSPYAVNSSAYYHADGNGNITYLLRSDAAANASYKYDPFGRLLSSSGTLAAANVMRFSSKPILLSSQGTWGDYYYGYRFYDPESQRWLNRDPIGERGGLNLYTMARNAPTIFVDKFGMSPGASGPNTSWPEGGEGFFDERDPINDAISCGLRVKDEVWNKYGWDMSVKPPIPQPDHVPGDDHFHYGHCVAHCRIQRECPGGRVTSWLGGIAKEAIDQVKHLVGGDSSGGGWENGDLDANREGRRRGRQCPEKTCEEACKGTKG